MQILKFKLPFNLKNIFENKLFKNNLNIRKLSVLKNFCLIRLALKT